MVSRCGSGRRRWRDRSLLLILLTSAVGLLTVSCEKVPLLAPTSASITLTALATALPINGTTDLIVQVLEQAGTPPHSGTHVTFTATLGSVQPSEAETDLNGRVVVKFLAGTASGTATITASSGGAGSSGAAASGAGATATDSRTVKIAIGSAAVARIAVTANPGTVPASGGNSIIVASVADGNGNPLPSVPVTFTSDAGSFSAAVVNTDESGNAQTTLTTNKTAKVTASAGVAASGTGTTASGVTPATVTVNVNTVPTIAVTATPALPVVGQPVAFSITVTPSTTGSTVQRVTIDYGDGTPVATLGGQSTTVSHVYTSAGSYVVRATAIDAVGDVSSNIVAVTIGARPQPTLSLSASASGQTATFTVTANPATGSNSTIQDVAIDFGDGMPRQDLGAATGASTVQHIYGSAGTFTATATATDSNGGRTSATTSIVIGALSVSLASGKNPASATNATDQPVTFTATPSTGAQVDHYEWTFGDTSGRSTSSNITNHSYTVVGIYTVTVTMVTTNGSRASSSIEQRITP